MNISIKKITKLKSPPLQVLVLTFKMTCVTVSRRRSRTHCSLGQTFYGWSGSSRIDNLALKIGKYHNHTLQTTEPTAS